MNNEYINRLSKLSAEERCLKRNLDKYEYDSEKRFLIFQRLKKVQDEIKITKSKLKLLKELKKC